jgi:hypothetical protein
MNTQIDITENKTTTLATAGLYCDRDIDVNVMISHTGCFDGTISGEYVDNELTTLKYCAFHSCINLTKISLPNCVTANYRAFYTCANVEEMYLPKLTTILTDGSSFFAYCSKLKELDLPNLTTIASGMDSVFSNCSELTRINLPNLGEATIKRYCFANCYKLHTLILGGPFKALDNTNAFNWAGSQAEKSLSIYVPDDLVNTYKTATNWVSYASKIKPMSELEE